MKSWEEINREYTEELELLKEHRAQMEQEAAEETAATTETVTTTAEPEPETEKNLSKREKRKAGRRKVSAVISNVIFYGAIVLLLFATIMVSSGDNGDGSVLGYRYYHILTSSMNSVYPKGSFVIVKENTKNDIQVGDDITFYTDPNTTVTHRVIDIIEDYDGKGAKGYETQGTENLNPDPDINHEENVVGKVVYCIPKLGSAMDLLKEHMVFVFIIFIAAIVISLVVRMLIASRRRDKEWVEIPK